ncbi:hypothetical protein ACFW08_20240 [Streptomyces sp. NPDC058960]|uniref:hypothetical protein n=1 Tax=Streptomyces sp. NPDC058960 TaxID=3346679 RepID=UPI0036C2B25C
MAGEQQVSLIKGGTRRENKGTTTLRVVGPAPALMDGTAKPAIADVGAAPTQAQFNALLAALRTRGVIS